MVFSLLLSLEYILKFYKSIYNGYVSFFLNDIYQSCQLGILKNNLTYILPKSSKYIGGTDFVILNVFYCLYFVD